MHESTDAYLKKAGLLRKPGKDGSIRLYTITNRDGSPRWIWNAANPNPDFLRFYAASSLRAKAFCTLVRIIFGLRLQNLIWGKHSLFVQREEGHVLASITAGHFALFTGTAGPNRKLVLYSGGQFIKVALNAVSNYLIQNEALTLGQMQNGEYTRVPKAGSAAEGMVALSDLGKNGKRINTFTPLHAASLKELQQSFPVETGRLDASVIYRASLATATSLQGKSAAKIPAFLIEKLERLANHIGGNHFRFTWAHRDFTPWNCFITPTHVNLYDFELSHPRIPEGFDVIHFVMQQGILAERLPWKQIKPRLQHAFAVWNSVSGHHDTGFDPALQAYLLINTSYYLDIYSRQEDWHEQIHWLLNTWNDAISDVLRGIEEPRALLIGDLFDFLHRHPYAGLKFPETHPKALGRYTDIDLLMPQKSVRQLLSHLRNHSLVSHVQLQKQSHMVSAQIVLANGDLLALDLIWQLKRKALEFMDVHQCIESAVVNPYGIKCVNAENTREYLRLFYGLNHSAVPEKYRFLLNEEQPVQTGSALQQQIRKLPANQGYGGWLNSIRYAADMAKRLLVNKGMIITFSGVDGAGKSTVIEHTKNLLEKQLRRPVVVIRHRPSVLPILSAITQGKAAAESKAANTLPRQGNNRSRTSSLLRFAYYYTDYLFGQFYVYLRYVMKGNIVLYDRYYFDFINDGLRSNIHLPKWLAKAGYRFLLKPDINFFLYADAQTIRSRKKELEEGAIRQLTGDYLQLFRELDARHSGRYVSIENIQLGHTLDIITAKAKAKLLAS